ncbi:hypothetical protein [Rhodoplanes elegans]|nr:hypothetical protein [Rhodoplanes elegans]
MTSHSSGNYSLWPERARPTRRRLSFARLGGVASVMVVIAAAGYMVVDEMTRNSALDAPIGRSWEDYAATTGAGTVGAGTVGLAPAATQAPVANAPAAAAATSAAPSAAPRQRRGVSATALTPIGTAGPSRSTDGRRVPDGRPPIDPATTSAVAAPPPAPVASAPAASAPPATGEPPKEAIMAAGEDKPAAEPAKPKKKKAVRRKPRTETVDQGWGGNRRADAWQRNGWGQSWGGQRQGGFFPY